MNNIKLQKYSYKFRKKALAVILAGVFLFTNTVSWATEEELFLTGMRNDASSSSPADNDKLAPPSKLNDEEFKYSLTVGAICKHVEHDGNLDDKSYLNDVLARLDAGKNPNVMVLPYEIIIEIPHEGLAVRYFDPTKANVITPYSDISKLSTKVISPRLHRQVIHKVKALPAPQATPSVLLPAAPAAAAPSSGVDGLEIILEDPAKVGIEDLLGNKYHLESSQLTGINVKPQLRFLSMHVEEGFIDPADIKAILIAGAVKEEVEGVIRMLPGRRMTIGNLYRHPLEEIMHSPDLGKAGPLRIVRFDASDLDPAIFPDSSYDLWFMNGIEPAAYSGSEITTIEAQNTVNRIIGQALRVVRSGGYVYDGFSIINKKLYRTWIRDGYIKHVEYNLYQRTTKPFPSNDAPSALIAPRSASELSPSAKIKGTGLSPDLKTSPEAPEASPLSGQKRAPQGRPSLRIPVEDLKKEEILNILKSFVFLVEYGIKTTRFGDAKLCIRGGNGREVPIADAEFTGKSISQINSPEVEIIVKGPPVSDVWLDALFQEIKTVIENRKALEIDSVHKLAERFAAFARILDRQRPGKQGLSQKEKERILSELYKESYSSEYDSLGLPPFAPTSVDLLWKIWQAAAGIGGKESILDLGSGDGRAVLAAAVKGFKKCIGVELRKDLVVESEICQNLLLHLGVDEVRNARFVHGDFTDQGVVDFSEFEVFHHWESLTGGARERLSRRLQEETKPGTLLIYRGAVGIKGIVTAIHKDVVRFYVKVRDSFKELPMLLDVAVVPLSEPPVSSHQIDKEITEDSAVVKNHKDYIDKHREVFQDILGEGKPVALLRVPIEVIKSMDRDNTKNLLMALQGSPNVYVELYQMLITGEVGESEYQEYGLQKKALPKGFKRTRENTVTLFPASKDEEINQSTIVSRLGDIDVTPENTILSPIGLQHDPAGLIRATVLGLKMLDIARQIKEKGSAITKDQAFKDKIQLEILEQLKNVCDIDDLKNFNLTADDIIALTTGKINNIITALKKLIRLLPITPINVEELRQIYEHFRAVITAA